MRTLDLEAIHDPEFSEYANTGEGNAAAAEDGEFSVGMIFGSRESSEPQTFYAKCKGYGAGCDWLIRASLIRKKACWEIRRYNSKHTCTVGTISQDHAELDSDTIADTIRPLVESDPSIKVKSVIAEVQSRFNYTLAKQKAVAKVFGDWEVSYQTLPVWLKAMMEYNKNYERLKERGEAYTQWCDEIGVERWVLAFDGGHRWGHMTTYLVECINSVLKGARNLPVTALVRSTFYRLNELFTRKSTEAHERLRNGFTYSEFATKRVEESF
ncbi:hypothetical protein Ahy_B05g079633 [Arachis hypogaea]|uniref:Transposase MuDR plant domain-containing protein n=1 Tax=Arachis hypogaea TaxID=3818 RepID=A0A444ZAE8_ARAHY|nr:hypothetical protein Ahy_B05g079633 [Arachis hypogaea]